VATRPVTQTVGLHSTNVLSSDTRSQMENLTNRFCDYHKDHDRLMKFWLDYRATSDVRMYPTIWRIRLLLTSRVWDKEKDAQIWENEAGEIIGFAMLWRRQPTSPYIAFNSFVLPKFSPNELFSRILQWGDDRVNEIAKRREGQFTVYVTGLSQSHFSANLLGQYGYTILSPNPEEHNVYFVKRLQNEIRAPLLPSGYEIRKLRDIEDSEAYQTLYGFAKVNPLHQKELIESDEYSHFVIVNSGGEFVAYCECSICRSEWERTNQRIGWIDYVETQPEQQKKGLGRAALSAGLLQLQQWGTETAMLITMSTNIPAITLYNKTGFDLAEIPEHPIYQKQIAVLKTD
jgi:ribosomal protein S18 acetylase RimI-like enzyme